MSNIIFVVGSPRSGTTYLSRALGLAENACYLGESTLFCLSAERIDRAYYKEHMLPHELFPYNSAAKNFINVLDCIRRKDRILDAAEHMLRMSKVKDYDLKPSDTLYRVQNVELDQSDCNDLKALASRLRSALEKDGVAAFAKSYIDEYARRMTCQTVIEKTPMHLRYLPVLHATFPHAKMVMLCRDKEDCLRSYLKTCGKGPGINRFLPRRIARWKVWRELQEDVRRENWAVNQPWIRKVEFSDFVSHPRQILNSLSLWLGLDFDYTREELMFPSYNRK